MITPWWAKAMDLGKVVEGPLILDGTLYLGSFFFIL